MSIQFLVEVSQQIYRTKLVLPSVFTETLYTAYITDSRYVRVNTLHFIRAAPDEYYVIGYHNDGSECNGYDLDRVGFRQRRCLLIVANMEESQILSAQFFPNLVNNRVRVMVSDLLTSTVTLRLVPLAQNRRGHVLSGQGWHILVYVKSIQVGNRRVFTNLLNNCISMIPFTDSGLGLRFERVIRMPLNGRVSFVINPIDKDPRMRHECVWDNHEEHHNDEECFYSPIVAYVTERNRLTIPWWFFDGNKTQTFHNAYLVYDEECFNVDLDWVYESCRMVLNVTVNEMKANGLIEFICFLVGDYETELVLPLEVWPSSCLYDEKFVNVVDAKGVVHLLKMNRNYKPLVWSFNGDKWVEFMSTVKHLEPKIIHFDQINACPGRVAIEFNGVVSDIGISFSVFSRLKKLVGVAFTGPEWERICQSLMFSASKVLVISSDEYSGSFVGKSFMIEFSSCAETKGYLSIPAAFHDHKISGDSRLVWLIAGNRSLYMFVRIYIDPHLKKVKNKNFQLVGEMRRLKDVLDLNVGDRMRFVLLSGNLTSDEALFFNVCKFV
ncbi:hypothetical protein Tco_1391599 [Tanacetum coccineum]